MHLFFISAFLAIAKTIDETKKRKIPFPLFTINVKYPMELLKCCLQWMNASIAGRYCVRTRCKEELSYWTIMVIVWLRILIRSKVLV